MQRSTRFVVNVLSNWAHFGFAAIVGAIVLPYGTSALGESRFGIYLIVSSVLAFLGAFDFGLSGAVARFASQDQGAGDLSQLRATATTSWLLLSGLGVLGATLLVICIPSISSFFEVPQEFTAGLRNISICLAIAFALRMSSVTDCGVLVGGNRYDLINGIEILSNVTRLATLVSLFNLFTPSLLLFGLTFVATQLTRWVGFRALVRLVVVKKPIYGLSYVSRSAIKRLVTFSAVNALNVLGYLGLMQGVIIVIGRMLGTEWVTRFAPAQLVGTQLRSVIAGVSSPLVPLAGKAAVSTKAHGDMANWSLRISRISCVIASCLVLPSVLFAAPLLRFWMGPEYEVLAPEFSVWVFAQLLASVQSGNYFLALGGAKISPWAVSQIVAVVLALSLAVVGQSLYQWGLIGVLTTMSIVVVIRNGLYLPILACSQFGVNPVHYYLHTYVRPLAAALVSAGVSLILSHFIPPNTVARLVWQALANMTLYAIIAWVVAVDRADRVLLVGLVRMGWARMRGMVA